MVDPKTDAGAWQQYGALLAAVDRLRVEVEAAVRPSDTVWRPPRVGELQQEAVRRFRRERAARATRRRRRRDNG
jgi:wyosine [tRNA(Phe)-imidazoG37] synthetase (radical SAM superfamily)